MAGWLTTKPKRLLTATVYSPAALVLTLTRERRELVRPTRFTPLRRHWKLTRGAPVATTENETFAPSSTVRLTGCVVMTGDDALTVRVAGALTTTPARLLTTTE